MDQAATILNTWGLALLLCATVLFTLITQNKRIEENNTAQNKRLDDFIRANGENRELLVRSIDARFDGVDRRFDTVEQRLKRIEDAIEHRLVR